VVTLNVHTKDEVLPLNIAFFEHRNSDELCAVKWGQCLMNSPTINTAKFGDKVYTDKYDVSHSTSYGKAMEMVEWIANELEEYFTKHSAKKADV